MSEPAVRLRRAAPSETARLRELLTAAKGFWGYDPGRVADWAATLDLDATLREQEVWVADVHGQAVAWAGLLPPREGAAVLEHLWVAPGHMRQGLGAALFRLARERAAELGARWMEWEAEPNALDFYRAMGGRRVRGTISEWGRPIDVMAVAVGDADTR